jgi:hypothetical protein
LAYFEDSNDGKRTAGLGQRGRYRGGASSLIFRHWVIQSQSAAIIQTTVVQGAGTRPKRAWRWWTPWPCARWRRSCCGARNRCRVPLSLAPLPATELQIPLEENSLDSNSPRCKLPTSICVHTRARAYMPVCIRINPTLLRVCLLHVCIFTHVHTYMHINTYTCTYIQMYIHAYAHTYTCATIYAHKP